MPDDAHRRKRLIRARKVTSSPRRVPSDEQSEAIVACLLDATARVLEADGWNALSTNRVAKVAGVGIGTLYRYFPNREALGRGLVHKTWNDELTVMAGAGNGAPPRLRDMAVAYVRHVARSPRLYAEWSTHLVHLVAEDARPWDAMVLAGAMAAFDHEFEDDPRKPMVCEVLYVTVVHVVRRAALVRPESLADGSLEQELVLLTDAYLAPFRRRAVVHSP